MATSELGLPRELTASSLDDLPADGRRWELIEGMLVVTPAPAGPHQLAVLNLAIGLRAARPEGLAVMIAPFDFRPSESVNLQPDLLVLAAEEATKLRTAETPLLVVEVRSPSTRANDLGAKRLAYEGLGVPSYWIVDPDVPSITVLELEDGRYAERGEADDVLEVDRPFPVRIDVARLLDR